MSRYKIIPCTKEGEIDRIFNQKNIIRWQIFDHMMYIEYDEIETR